MEDRLFVCVGGGLASNRVVGAKGCFSCCTCLSPDCGYAIYQLGGLCKNNPSNLYFFICNTEEKLLIYLIITAMKIFCSLKVWRGYHRNRRKCRSCELMEKYEQE